VGVRVVGWFALLTLFAFVSTVFTLNEDFIVTVEDNKSRSMSKARQALDACQPDTYLPVEAQIAALTDCMEAQVQKALNQTQEEISFQASLRLDMGKSLLNYACEDPDATTTKPFRNESWSFTHPTTKEVREHNVQVLFETDYSAVKYIPGMLSPEQCSSLLKSTVELDGQQILPTAAKASLPTVEILMKVQNLYKS
jgi:septal ring-binding cell division protein DamX